MNSMFYTFTTNKSPQLYEVGGKAKALIETTKAGFPVPEGVVLSVDFFSEWIDDIKETKEWKSIINDVTKARCDSVKDIVLKQVLSDKQKNALEQALKIFDKDTIYAIRSSSPEEDIVGTSFAGMYESVLGVTSDQIEERIVSVFSSLFDFRVMEYKRQHGMDIEKSNIAIIIQKQIASESSGIGFSLNPNNNCYDEVVINSAPGLGEMIVSGEVTPDVYIINKQNKMIVDKKINSKTNALWLEHNGGTILRKNENPEDEALNDIEVGKLVDLIIKCEEYYGIPMDIEWAFEGEEIFLLQSRPITTYFPLYEEYITKPGEPKHIYIDLIKLTQGFEYSLSELGADLFSKMIVSAKQGLMPEGRDGAFYNVNGRLYMDLTNMERAFGRKMVKRSIGSYDIIVSETLKGFDFKDGYRIKEKPDKLKKMMKSGLKMGVKLIPALLKASKNPDDQYKLYFDHARNGFKLIDDVMASDIPFDGKVGGILDMFEEMMFYAMPALSSMRLMPKIIKMFDGMGLEDDIVALNIDLKGNPTSDMGYRLVELASFDEIQKIKEPGDFVRKMKKREFSKEFLKCYDDYMKLYGCRCVGEIDIAAIRPYEELDVFFKQLKLININDNAMQRSKLKKAESYNRLLEASKSINKERRFIKYAKVYEMFGIREHPKYMFVYAIDKLRGISLSLGKQFVALGRLDTVNDIFMLNASQIARAEHDKSYDIKGIVRENKKKRSKTKDVKSWPVVIDSRGKIFRRIRESLDGDIVGEAVSPGRVTGVAKVLSTPYEKPLEKGDILVAKATEPTWTPIFINASAVVMEIGGQLQHGAIIAREYGIPCVSSIDQATTIIKDGDLIEVDGSNGVVRIIK